MKEVVVVGLGYVGLPLAVCLSRKYSVRGYDVDQQRITELRSGLDSTGEVNTESLKHASITFSSDPTVITGAELVIIAVPTPIDGHKRPDLKLLLKATRRVGQHLSAGTTVVYESTVYPGATEEACIPVLEAESGLTWKKEFNVGYSPERINPGDKDHTIEKILKVVSGDAPDTVERLAAFYSEVIEAGVFKAESIKTAEAAKVIENCQRDINIAFVNELALICQRLGLDTSAVLEAAGTKWNFLPFQPGLVGGHCIGVDPYYLTYKAEAIGYHPQVILSGRRINDGMPAHIANRVVKLLIERDFNVRNERVLILGITFKENCQDIRNSQVIHIINELNEFGLTVDVYDPVAGSDDVLSEYGFGLLTGAQLEEARGTFAAVIHAVAHADFRDFRFRDYLTKGGVLYDVKSSIPIPVDERL